MTQGPGGWPLAGVASQGAAPPSLRNFVFGELKIHNSSPF